MSANFPLTPALSRGERGNHSPSQCKAAAVFCWTTIQISRSTQRLFPLPEGGGQGEGKRNSQTHQNKSFCNIVMNPLVKKEIRLLLPSWLVISSLAILLPWFSCNNPFDFFVWMPLFMFFGVILLAVDSFGREFSLGTFSSLMSQPMERRRIWRMKITVLFFAAALIYACDFISSDILLHRTLRITRWSVSSEMFSDDFNDAMVRSVIAVLIALMGGLWTTLLLRQISAAFWITFLVPLGLLMLITFFMPATLAANDHILFPPLYSLAGIYCATGFWLAHRLFHRAQDAAWTWRNHFILHLALF